MLRLRKVDSRGDTIVEVMVVLAIIGLAVGIAYATASRSLLDTSQAEENAQATNYAQSEVEYIRDLAPTSTNNPSSPTFNSATNIFKPTATFCVPLSSPPQIVAATGNNCSFGTIPYQVVVYNCDFYSGGSPNVCSNMIANTDTFVVVATWPDIFGYGNDTATLTYRIHPL